jgi:hypothetical protein
MKENPDIMSIPPVPQHAVHTFPKDYFGGGWRGVQHNLFQLQLIMSSQLLSARLSEMCPEDSLFYILIRTKFRHRQI